MWNDKWSAEGLSLFGRANFDPGSLMAASIGATAIGAAQALASAQRTAYETRLRTGLPLETDGSPPSS